MKANRNFYEKDLKKTFTVKKPQEFLDFWKIDNEKVRVNYRGALREYLVKNTTFTDYMINKTDYEMNTFFIYTKNKFELAFYISIDAKKFSISSVVKTS